MSFRDRRGQLFLEGEGTNYKDKLIYYEGVNLVGRNPAKTTLTIKDKSISQIHAKIICKDNSIRIVDTKSKNGVYLNDMQNQITPEVQIDIDPKKDIVYFAQIKGKFVPDEPVPEKQDQTKDFTVKAFKPNVNGDIKQPPKESKNQKQEPKEQKKQNRQKSTKQKGKAQNTQKLEQQNSKKTKKLQPGNKEKEKQKEKQKQKQKQKQKNAETMRQLSKNQQASVHNEDQKNTKKEQKKKGKKQSKEKNRSAAQTKQPEKELSIQKKNKGQKSKQSKETRDEQAIKKQKGDKQTDQNDEKKENRTKKEIKQKKSESSQTKVKQNNKRKNKSVGKIQQQNQGKQKSLVNRKKLPESLNDSFGNHPRRSIVHKTVLISSFTLGFKPTIKLTITQNWRDPFDVLVMEKYARTFKLLYAICLGIPVVTLNWIVQSQYRRGIVSFERFYLQGPQKQVIPKSSARARQGQKVFMGLKFYLIEGQQSFHLPTEQIVALIQAGGGILVKKINKKQLPVKDIIFIVRTKYNDEDLKILNKIEGVVKAYTVQMILDSCLHQQIKWDENKVPAN